ncbi:hypothetical protein [Bacillus cereus group sp. BfR-BA-01400]|uniref:hypothetical protein n=1 Tax=Bacillus cereus group sp. BfR-BA-01400 TaxID=2920334 RepID=UPI001F58CEE0
MNWDLINWNLIAIIVALSFSILLFVIFLWAETTVDNILTNKEIRFAWVAIVVILVVIALTFAGTEIGKGFSVLLSISATFWSCKEILVSYHERIEKGKSKFVWFLKWTSIVFLVSAGVYGFLYAFGIECAYLEKNIDDGLLGILGVAFLALANAAKKKTNEKEEDQS